MLWSLYYCLFMPHIYMGIVLRAHPVRGESHIQRNAKGEVATTSLLFYNWMNRKDCMLFLKRLHLARPSHPGHSTILLRSENMSSMCAKLRNVAASAATGFSAKIIRFIKKSLDLKFLHQSWQFCLKWSGYLLHHPKTFTSFASFFKIHDVEIWKI